MPSDTSQTTETGLVAIVIFVGAMSAANAATVRGSPVMACPSIEAWERVMEGLHTSGVSAAGDVGNQVGCVSVPPGTSVNPVGRAGPLSRVVAPDGRTFFFRSEDLK